MVTHSILYHHRKKGRDDKVPPLVKKATHENPAI